MKEEIKECQIEGVIAHETPDKSLKKKKRRGLRSERALVREKMIT